MTDQQAVKWSEFGDAHMLVTWPAGLQVSPCHWHGEVVGSQLGRAVAVGSKLAFNNSKASSCAPAPAAQRSTM